MNYLTTAKNGLNVIFLTIALMSFTITRSLSAEFKVTKVYDGNTLKAEGGGIEIKVRMVGIDAPEIGETRTGQRQPYSLEAREHLAGMILDKIVDIKGYGYDRCDYVLGEVFLDNEDINLAMVRSGLLHETLLKGQSSGEIPIVLTRKRDLPLFLEGVAPKGIAEKLETKNREVKVVGQYQIRILDDRFALISLGAMPAQMTGG